MIERGPVALKIEKAKSLYHWNFAHGSVIKASRETNLYETIFADPVDDDFAVFSLGLGVAPVPCETR
jgi:hypothetical protein